MKTLIILLVLIRLTYAVEFFKSGTIESEVGCNDVSGTPSCLFKSFNYINPKTSSIEVTANFIIEGTTFVIQMNNGNRRTYRIRISENQIRIYDSLLNPLFTDNITMNYDPNHTYKMVFNYTPETAGSFGGVITLSIYAYYNGSDLSGQQDILIYKSPELLGTVSYFNEIEIFEENTGAILPSLPGSSTSSEDALPPVPSSSASSSSVSSSIFEVSDWKIIVTPATTKRNVVVVPMF